MRALHEHRPNRKMQFGMLVFAALLIAGHLAVLCFIATYLWSIALAVNAGDWPITVASVALPGLSQGYWLGAAPESMPGRGWLTFLNVFWMLAFLAVGFFATIAPETFAWIGKKAKLVFHYGTVCVSKVKALFRRVLARKDEA